MDSTDNIEVFVEIPRGSRNKYEYDEEKGAFRLDRVLYSSVHYPADYGFVPDTLAPDGDRLDVLVMVDEPTFPGCLVLARPVGLLHMIDQGMGDYKVLAVPVRDPRYDEYRDLDSVPQHWLLEIENFFRIYKTLEGKETEIHGWEPREKARQIICEARKRNTESLSQA